jgi:hypothetical protein
MITRSATPAQLQESFHHSEKFFPIQKRCVLKWTRKSPTICGSKSTMHFHLFSIVLKGSTLQVGVIFHYSWNKNTVKDPMLIFPLLELASPSSPDSLHRQALTATTQRLERIRV